ncbi:c-type cytochrome biogenesis protein CcmI [Oceanisphaera pacifica]|uniref:C-type cytochrome biogenesis protein CcmI n=1 Tax=Oceanisphaera pacifica TaxID=2818389 RepID=A0ABS3NGT2_9GAMM|nr:c-type cytochrome biogenesis protein CcmI [Oceanisphaera pacifica]MBO1519808.1 c-type cytochrome biogenesis protein CcmI [Oceanisphaera pacifica]
MLLFWIVSALLTLVLALVIILPLTRGRAESINSRNQLNTELYKQRLQELEQDREQGLLEESEEATQELQKSLLDDVVSERPQQYRSGVWLWLPAVLIVIAVSVVGYWQMGAYSKVEQWQDNTGRLSELTRQVLLEPDGDITEQDMLDLIQGLRTKLYTDGDDFRGWLLLGRLTLEMRDGETARDALDKAMQLATQPEQSYMVMVPYAEALAITGEALRAENIIKQVLAEDPNNLEAWSVFAFMAMQQDNLTAAIARWQEILQRMSPSNPRYTMVERSVAFAEQRLAEEDHVPVTGPRYEVEVNTSSNTPYHPGAVLFVYAMDGETGGSAAPLVAQRIENPGFPLTVTLTNADAMRPDNNMNGHSSVVIKARLAPSGNVADTTGAWEGSSRVLSTEQDKQLSIVIDTEL